MLDAETMMRQFDLARQPLLLALLALYDAEKNALRNAENLSQPELYERIFRRYLEREVEKGHLPIRRNEQTPLIEQRFRELSTIAIGMLNRGRRFITKQEVIDDFNSAGVRRDSTLRTESTSADDAVGQFFFLYRAQAQQQESVLNEGYEFIHATFGEFLAARIIAKQLARASDVVRGAPTWDRAEAERHARSLLVPYLARRPLVGEEQTLLYLGDIVGTLVKARRPAALAITAHIPALLKSGIPDENSQNADRGQLERLATLTINLAVAALRTANAPLPLSAFCDEDQEPITQWRRLTALWQAYLAMDDWDRVLSSFILSKSQEYELSWRNVQDKGREDLGTTISDPYLRRAMQTGLLTDDPHLRAAAMVWGWVQSAFLPDDSTELVSAEWLIASAFFRISPANQVPETVKQALGELDELRIDNKNILELIVAGPVRWPDEMLTEVVSYLTSTDDAVAQAGDLVKLIMELDRRDSSALARKLLKLFSSGVIPGSTHPADIAAMVSLSRRHQVPELLSRYVLIDSLPGRVMDWLSIEDIAWIFQSKAISPQELQRLRERLRADARYRRALERAIELAAEE
jgi:hypothetical protein